MKRYRWVLAAVFAAVAITAGGCGKTDENIPITTISQSTDDEDPEDNLEELPGEEIPEYEVELPEDAGSFSFAVWGDVYTIPMSYADFTEMGWEYSGDDTKTIKAETYSEDEGFIKDGNVIHADMINPDTAKKELRECLIGGIHIDTAKADGQDIHVNLPGDIVMQQSLLDDVQEAYGVPKDRYEEGDRVWLTYEYGLYQTITLGFDSTAEVLVTLDMQNFTTPDKDEELSDVSDAVTPEVEAYETPEAAGTSLQEFIVEYAGVLYHLPAPVSQFTANGWTVNEKESDKAVKNGNYGYVTLEKDGQKLFGVVHNYGTDPTTIRNCFVTALYGDMDTTKVPITVAGGITLGMSEDQFLLAAGQEKYEKTEDTDNQTDIYTFYVDDTKMDYTAVSIDRTLHLVRGIKVVHNMEEDPSAKESRADEDASAENETVNQKADTADKEAADQEADTAEQGAADQKADAAEKGTAD